MKKNDYLHKEFKDFWKIIEKQNPDKVGKIGILTFDELKVFCKNIFVGARKIKE